MCIVQYRCDRNITQSLKCLALLNRQLVVRRAVLKRLCGLRCSCCGPDVLCCYSSRHPACCTVYMLCMWGAIQGSEVHLSLEGMRSTGRGAKCWQGHEVLAGAWSAGRGAMMWQLQLYGAWCIGTMMLTLLYSSGGWADEEGRPPHPWRLRWAGSNI